MKILIREGSAARNFDALIELLPEHYANLMFCSDDKHPDTLVLGHINQLVQRAVALGNDVFKVLQVACLNPVEHYQPAGWTAARRRPGRLYSGGRPQPIFKFRKHTSTAS